MPKEYEIVHPSVGFILYLEDGEKLEDVDIAEYFLDAVHDWVMECHPDDVRDRLTVKDF